jgi:hypothetical protein
LLRPNVSDGININEKSELRLKINYESASMWLGGTVLRLLPLAGEARRHLPCNRRAVLGPWLTTGSSQVLDIRHFSVSLRFSLGSRFGLGIEFNAYLADLAL